MSDLNRARYVIYAQFLDMDSSLLSCKSPTNNSMPPELGRRPDTFGEFHSPGSFMSSRSEYTISRVNTTRCHETAEGLADNGCTTHQQTVTKTNISSAALGIPISATHPHTYRRTDTNDVSLSAPPPIVPNSSAQL